MNDYQKGWLQALRVLKRDVDANPRWGSGDIYERLAELLDENRGVPVTEMRVTAPADSPLGAELSKIRDRLNALEVMHEGQPGKTDAWEKLVIERIEYLELQDRNTLAVFVEQRSKIEALERGGGKASALLTRIEALEAVVGSPAAPNRGLTSIVSRVEQLEKNGSQDAECITELQRRMGLFADVAAGKL